MTESALVHNVQTLADLNDALGSFARDASEALRSVDIQIGREQEWVLQRLVYWQRQQQQAAQVLRQAQLALNRCYSQVQIDRDGNRRQPDCSAQERSVSEAMQSLRATEINLLKATRARAQIESAVNEYRRCAGRLEHLVGSHSIRARTLLERLRSELEHYLSVAPSAGSPSAEVPVLSPMARMFVGMIPGIAGQAAQPSSEPGQAEEVWEDRGIQTVRLADLPEPAGIASEDDFDRWPADEMRHGLERLQEMLPAIESGEGRDSDYWAAVDRARGFGRAGPNSYQRIYEVFYGQRAAKVLWNGSSYEIEHGHHRIWLAKRMGLESLPVHLKERRQNR